MPPKQNRNRSVNFTDEEKILLGKTLAEFIVIVDSKKLDNKTIKVKDAAWDAVTWRFNNSSAIKRDVRQLRIFYNNWKRKLKKASMPEHVHSVILDAADIELLSIVKANDMNYNNGPSDGEEDEEISMNDSNLSYEGSQPLVVEPDLNPYHEDWNSNHSILNPTENGRAVTIGERNNGVEMKDDRNHGQDISSESEDDSISCNGEENGGDQRESLITLKRKLLKLKMKCMKQKHDKELELLKAQLENECLKRRKLENKYISFVTDSLQKGSAGRPQTGNVPPSSHDNDNTELPNSSFKSASGRLPAVSTENVPPSSSSNDDDDDDTKLPNSSVVGFKSSVKVPANSESSSSPRVSIVEKPPDNPTSPSLTAIEET